VCIGAAAPGVLDNPVWGLIQVQRGESVSARDKIGRVDGGPSQRVAIASVARRGIATPDVVYPSSPLLDFIFGVVRGLLVPDSIEATVKPAVKCFREFPFRDSVFEDLVAAGYEHPTPIQAASISSALEGKDVIGLAQTGTGKTAAFALPIINKYSGEMELRALVLAPTRELAVQITAAFNTLGRSSGIRVATLVGGVHMNLDEKALRSWPNVLVATPGRLNDHISYGATFLQDVQMLVIDEADRMHDMGFIPQVRRIQNVLPVNRQTMMFTATLDKEIESIVRQSMKNPVRIQVGQQSAPCAGAKQQLFAVTEEDKLPLLASLLGESQGRVLVFLRTKRGVDKLRRQLSRSGDFTVVHLHGDLEQYQRDDAMGGFRDGRYRVLIATDIAARGIDVADIEHVINYDFPQHPEDYVHRIGRTARAQAEGVASSFVTRMDGQYVRHVRHLIGDKLPNPIPVQAKSGTVHVLTDAEAQAHFVNESARSEKRPQRGGRGGGARRGGSTRRRSAPSQA